MAHKAPGKHYRKGATLADIFKMFPDDATAESWFVESRWPDDPICPYCGSDNVKSGTAHKTMPYRCREKECAKRFSVRTRTLMDSSNIGYQKWAVAILLMTTNLKGLSSMKLHRDLGVTQKSAWFMAHRIRQAMSENGSLFAGPVEADETFVGGLEGNKHGNKKIQGRTRHGRQGGGRWCTGSCNGEGCRPAGCPYRQRDLAGLRACQRRGQCDGLHR